MDELKAYRISFMNGNIYSKVIVLADSYEEAESILRREYRGYGLDIEIEEYEEMDEKGIILTDYYEITTN